MACDYLAISGGLIYLLSNVILMSKIIYSFLATSVSIERIFLGETDLVTQRRCSLQDETIQKFMCLKGWWKSGLED